jgi:hypothetical protein
MSALRCLIVAIALTSAQPADAQLPAEEMSGSWEGSVAIVGITPESARAGFRIGDSTRVRVDLLPDGRVSLGSPDTPGLQTTYGERLTNTVTILAVLEASDRSEHWALTIALREDHTIWAALSRGVRLMRSSAPADVFTVGALGQLRHVDAN